MMLKSLKKRITAAKKRGNSEQEKELKQRFIDHAKSL
jgi:hypothetical protein